MHFTQQRLVKCLVGEGKEWSVLYVRISSDVELLFRTAKSGLLNVD